MIAMAIAAKPKILIADEPTNDLDPITQSQILRLLSRMNQLHNTTILLIGHDLTTITQWATRITVMYCGQSVESADTAKLLDVPAYPIRSRCLKRCPTSTIGFHTRKIAVAARVNPPLQHLPIGCRLGPRCPYAQRQCVEILILSVLKATNLIVTSLSIWRRKRNHECIIRSQ